MAVACAPASTLKPSPPPFDWCETCGSRRDVHYDRETFKHVCNECRAGRGPDPAPTPSPRSLWVAGQARR